MKKAEMAAGLSALAEKCVVLDRVATMLGSCEEWSGADMLEAIAWEINRSGVYDHPVSDQPDEALAFWRARADALGIDHDGED